MRYLQTGMAALRLMPYDNIIDRDSPGGGALVPPEQSNIIFKQAEQLSAALAFMRRIPIRTNEKAIPVLSALPSAYWIGANGTEDTGLMQTTEAAWKNVQMSVANLGVIVPVPRRLIDDMKALDGNFSLTNEIIPLVAQAIGKKIDAAIFFGASAPTVWPDDIVTAATAAGNTVTASATAAEGGLHSDIISLIKKIRKDGFNVNVGVARSGFEYDLLDNRDTTGQPLITVENLAPGNKNVRGLLQGRQVMFTDGVFPAETTDSDAELILFDSSKHLIGLREEMDLTIHTSGVIQDNTGAIVYNLLQQDMVALRFILRVGYAVANPVTVAQETEANRYPGGVLYSADETP